jgi:hypothetical protein
VHSPCDSHLRHWNHKRTQGDGDEQLMKLGPGVHPCTSWQYMTQYMTIRVIVHRSTKRFVFPLNFSWSSKSHVKRIAYFRVSKAFRYMTHIYIYIEWCFYAFSIHPRLLIAAD